MMGARLVKRLVIVTYLLVTVCIMIVGDSEEMKAVWFTVERKEAMAWKQHEARTCHVKHEVCRLYTAIRCETQIHSNFNVTESPSTFRGCQ